MATTRTRESMTDNVTLRTVARVGSMVFGRMARVVCECDGAVLYAIALHAQTS